MIILKFLLIVISIKWITFKKWLKTTRYQDNWITKFLSIRGFNHKSHFNRRFFWRILLWIFRVAQWWESIFLFTLAPLLLHFLGNKSLYPRKRKICTKVRVGRLPFFVSNLIWANEMPLLCHIHTHSVKSTIGYQ